MKLLVTLDDHYKELIKLAHKAEVVNIFTFGIYAGILDDGRDTTEWGPKFRNQTHEFLDLLVELKCDTTITVGVPWFNSCTKEEVCIDCISKFRAGLTRINNTVKHWDGDFDWFFTSKLHAKAFLFFDEENPVGVVTGGRNLCDSTWDDLSFTLPMKQVEVLEETLGEIERKVITRQALRDYAESEVARVRQEIIERSLR